MIDRQQEKQKLKESSENGSENGSNEESDNEEKVSSLALLLVVSSISYLFFT